VSVAGRHSVLEAIEAGRAREIVVDPSHRAAARDVVTAAEAAGVPVRLSDATAGEPDGVVARLFALPALTERELAHRDYSDDALVVVLDGITDPQNLGAAARSAEAAGAELLLMRDRRSAPTTAAAVRASAGALLHLPFARVANIPRALSRLQELGFAVVGLDEHATRTIYDAPAPEGRIVLAVGAEDRGLSRLVRERCDELRSLPMRGRVASLNASAALAAALFGFVLPSRPPRSGR
jgi:23S rRNA (guanosine2251-2'-O)-methyltransferase